MSQRVKLPVFEANLGFVSKNSIPYRGRVACCRNDTCTPICPVGAKYSPDATWRTLRAANRITMLTRTLVRRLVPAPDSDRIEVAQAYSRERPTDEITIRARTFVIAGGYVWSPHLLLLSTSTRFPNGLANRAGLVGKYLTGHRNVSGFVALPMKLYPGINEQHSLVSKHFMRRPKYDRYLRHDLRVWESAVDKGPRLRNDAGDLMLGDGILNDWRARTQTGTARVRCYYDTIPAKDSELTLDASHRNAHGDPLPKLAWRDDPVSRDLRGWTVTTPGIGVLDADPLAVRQRRNGGMSRSSSRITSESRWRSSMRGLRSRGPRVRSSRAARTPP